MKTFIYIHDARQMAKIFNNHFLQVGQKLEKSIRPINKKYDNYLNERVENSFITEPANNDEVFSVIKQLKNGKTTGPNSQNTLLMKKCTKEISEPLTLLFSMSFSNGIFPEDDKTFVSNYRPISLISNIDKIMGKLMYQQLYLSLEYNNVIYHNQFGFQYNHSTEHALIGFSGFSKSI